MPRVILFNKPMGVLTQFTDANSPTPRPTLSGFGLPMAVVYLSLPLSGIAMAIAALAALTGKGQ